MSGRWMRRLRRVLRRESSRISGLREGTPRELRMADEFEFHLDMLIERNLRAGMSRDEARRQAMVQFGGVDRFSEATRDEYRSRPLADLWRDVRYAVRNLVRMPAFTIAVVLTLGFGIAATTVMYSIVDHVVLRPLPYPDADRLMLVRVTAEELADQIPSLAVNPVRFLEWRERCAVCEDVGAARAAAVTWTGAGDPVQLEAVRASPNLLPMLGARAVHGRLFVEEEAERGRTNEVVLVSHGFWQRELGGEPGAVGTSITLNERPRVIVGVLPPDFRLPKRDELGAGVGMPDAPEIYMPLTFADWELGGQGAFDYSVITLVTPGTGAPQLLSHLSELETRYRERYPGGLTISPLVRPLHEQVVGGSRGGLVLLLGAVASVLLLVCVNLASLLLARNASRAREAVVRVALGAGRGRLVRASLTESVVLALLAGAAGVMLAYIGLNALLRIAPPELPRLHEVTFDQRIAFAGIVLSLVTGMLFGVLPALRTGAADPQDVLRQGGRSQTASRAATRARAVLIATQVALTAVLLVAAGLFLSSFARVLGTDPGFQVERSLVLDVVVRNAGGAEGSDVAYGRLLGRLRTVPGVVSAAAAAVIPLDGTTWADAMSQENDARTEAERPLGNFHFVTPEYFSTLGIAVRGESFAERDRGRAVAVLSSHAASLLFPDGEDPIGRRVNLGSRLTADVIGVAANVAATGVATDPAPIVYLPPWTELGFPAAATVVLRTEGDPLSMLGPVREELRNSGTPVALARVRTLDGMIEEATAARRFQLTLLLIFALTALATACVGTYGVVAHSLAGRRAEVGVRMALGASRSDIHRLIVGHTLAATMIGLVPGTLVALIIARLIAGLLYGVSPNDPVVLGVVAAVLVGVTAAASWIPSRRVTGRALASALRE